MCDGDWDDESWDVGFSNVPVQAQDEHQPTKHRSAPESIRFGRGSQRNFTRNSKKENSARDGDSLTVMVDCGMCGKIIGKGGSMIRELEEKSGARIKVQRDEKDGFKVPVIVNGDEQACQEAAKLIENLLHENGKFGGRRSGGNDFNPSRHCAPLGGRSPMGEQKTIYIEASQCGRVIGRGGSKITEFQGESGAYIKVNTREGDGDKVPVVLSGDQAAVDKAEKLIMELLNVDKSYKPFGLVNRFQEDTDNKGERDGLTSSGFIDWASVNNLCCEQSRKRWESAVPIRKTFYIEDSHVADMLPYEVEQWRKENLNICVTHLVKENPHAVLNPVKTFEQAFQHYPEVLDTIRDQGFEKPSPIQSQAWPLAMNGYDVIGIAQTGTGKTLAFLLPAFVHIDGQPTPRNERSGPSCLILTPTRELALQIEMEIKKYHYRSIRCVCVYGGGDRRKQINLVSQGVEIIVATPGRFNDLLANEFLSLDSVTFLVLDEADRMLDMGFEPQIMKILIDIRPDRQTMMTSATWPEGVRRLARSYLTDPMQVAVGSLDLAAVHTVHQIVEVIAQEEKKRRLLDFIGSMDEKDKVLVFVGRKTTADILSTDLCMMNISCQSIHGGREQYDREQALDDFKTGAVRILVATDVASRGLDVADVTHVLNYDYPRNIEEYVHRVGRTGRAGKSGTSITLVTREDWSTAKELIDILEEAQQDVPNELYDMAERFTKMKERRDREGGFRGGRRGGFRRNNRW